MAVCWVMDGKAIDIQASPHFGSRQLGRESGMTAQTDVLIMRRNLVVLFGALSTAGATEHAVSTQAQGGDWRLELPPGNVQTKPRPSTLS